MPNRGTALSAKQRQYKTVADCYASYRGCCYGPLLYTVFVAMRFSLVILFLAVGVLALTVACSDGDAPIDDSSAPALLPTAVTTATASLEETATPVTVEGGSPVATPWTIVTAPTPRSAQLTPTPMSAFPAPNPTLPTSSPTPRPTLKPTPTAPTSLPTLPLDLGPWPRPEFSHDEFPPPPTSFS